VIASFTPANFALSNNDHPLFANIYDDRILLGRMLNSMAESVGLGNFFCRLFVFVSLFCARLCKLHRVLASPHHRCFFNGGHLLIH
jgi:hypothetical protein